MSQRFRSCGRDSFFGDNYLELAVPQNHFLRLLKDLVNWERLAQGWADCYKGGAQYGPVPYHPALLLKMLFLSFLYKMPERQSEEFANDSVAARYFLALAAHQSAPDHSSLTVFRKRILEKKGPKAFEEVFQQVVRLAQEKGIVFGSIQVVDATHSVADVDVGKDEKRWKAGAGRRDSGAAWGTKGSQRVKTAEGQPALVNRWFHGYKTHLSLNAQSGMITSVVATAGNESDGKQFRKLVDKDEEVGVEAQIYAGDKAYDDGDNHELLRSRGKSSALCLNAYRTQKYPDGLWADIKGSEEYQQGQRQRYKIEQKNAEAKRWHALGRCRYLGWAKYAVQALMTALAMNLKRMVWLLCGVRFRGASGGLARV